jgi:cardiolipin synthase (CMP-forming)
LRPLVPLALTLARLPLAALVWLVAPWPWALFAVMVLAGLTDVLDGWAARRLGVADQRRSGAWLDPLCDKIFVMSTLIAVLVFYQPPWWWLILIVARECVQAPLALAYHIVPGVRRRMSYDFRAGRLGKAATIVQFLAIWALIFDVPGALYFAAAAAAAGLAAATVYVGRAVRRFAAAHAVSASRS